jgi:serine/threonine-protein kinase
VAEGAADAARGDAALNDGMESMRGGLSSQQLSRLGELLDVALQLPAEERRAWLGRLQGEDLPLVQALREALLADDPQAEADRAFPPLHAPRRAGERLGAYELLQPLGTGGMAEVWLARRADGAFERQVALKIPRLSHVPHEMAERFARECRLLATLEYPGIARLYDAGIDATHTPYIAMEYVQGEALLEYCTARALDTAARVRLFLQVLDAVGHAHAQGIIHRDLKPSNILVTGKGEARLLDFGVASLLRANTDPRALTRIYGRALTPEYASPELLRGEPIDQRSDVYSLGIVLHELLTGVRPGQRTADGGMPEPDATLRAIVQKALASAPADRYPDVAAFAAALRPHAADRRESRADRRMALRVLTGAVVLAVAAVIAAFAIYRWRGAAGPAQSAELADAAARAAQPAIAVLPFVDLSPAHDHGYLSDGLAEELIDLLTKIPELRVTARASSFAFRDGKHDIGSIARQLNVAHVLEGSVRTSGSRLKFSVQLVRAADGIAVWSETYDREMKDVFDIQESIAIAVVDALKVRLLAANAPSAEIRTANVRAYEEYLLGRQYRNEVSAERHQRAQAAFERAAALDPSFAPAHAGIALAAADLGSATMQETYFEQALIEAGRAIALAPRLTEAYVARAKVRMGRDWNFAGAKSDLDFAMRMDPNNIELLQTYAAFFWSTGDTARALEIQRRCVERNPLASRTWDWLGLMLMDARDYPEARRAFQRSAELSPYSDYRGLLMTLVELYSGNYAEALRLARANPDENFRDYSLSMAAFSAGDIAGSRAALQRLIARAPDLYAAQIALSYAWQGDGEQAFEWLERARALHDPGLLGLQHRPELEKFTADPRYERLLRQMNLRD